MPCLFCKIVARELPAEIVYQDEHVTAFKDLHPRAPTHILIIPNAHLASVDDLADNVAVNAAAQCLRVAREIARARGLTNGYRLVTNIGADAGQSVFHLHFHLLAGRRLGWPPG
ncbi:MAG: histidine triad nucleotide-binding protein [Chloroflexi bacterium UTCFX4]|nr:MAG: histidine triad nucleotide-binding protein [Chloroflexi bacterium UTCFX4]